MFPVICHLLERLGGSSPPHLILIKVKGKARQGKARKGSLHLYSTFYTEGGVRRGVGDGDFWLNVFSEVVLGEAGQCGSREG